MESDVQGEFRAGTASHQSPRAGTIVEEDYVEAGVKLDYAANNVAGLDRFGRVADQIWTDYGASPDAFLDRFTYGYDDRVGNRTSKTNQLHNALSETYEYNDLDELISTARDDNFDQSWTLDGLGNWSAFDNDGTSQTRTTNGANEITVTSGIATPTYDRAGNMTVIPSPSTDPNDWKGAVYDAWNRLVEVQDVFSLPVAKFVYDGTGRRIEQLNNFTGGVAGMASHYYQDGQQVIETREGSPTAAPESLDLQLQNVWSARYVDSLILRDTYFSGVLQPASRLYYLNDANYNVTTVVSCNPSVAVQERYVYSAYGKATIYTGDWSTTRSTSLVQNTTLFAGRELDVATGLYYNRARYYSADVGSFVNRDPIGYGGGDPNLYRYCGNNATNAADPSGLAGRKLTSEDVAKARAELKVAGLSEAEIAFRLKILENVYNGKVIFPDFPSQEVRNPAYWVKNSDDSYIPRNKPLDAIDALWNEPWFVDPRDGKLKPNGIQCNKYSKLIIMKAYSDLADEGQRRRLNRALSGKVLPDDLINGGEGLMWSRDESDGVGFQVSDLQPGDQIWFRNPYFKKLAIEDRGKRKYRGEQGSNLFYLGNGLVIGIYGGLVYTIEQYQQKMAGWGSVRHFDSDAPLSTFQIRTRNRPLSNPW